MLAGLVRVGLNDGGKEEEKKRRREACGWEAGQTQAGSRQLAARWERDGKREREQNRRVARGQEKLYQNLCGAGGAWAGIEGRSGLECDINIAHRRFWLRS